MSQIAVVDYGMGNLRSVSKALEHVANESEHICVSSDPDVIASADRIVFPGQGAARDCMRELSERGLVESVLKAANEKPFLGICMGLQVLMAHSEENGGVDCMKLYDGEVRYLGDGIKVDSSAQLKIPHMGWNQVQQSMEHPLWHKIEQASRFYFVHSYYVDPVDSNIVCSTTNHGIDFVSVVANEYVFAVQFHPEKSAQAGLQLLNNFIHWKN